MTFALAVALAVIAFAAAFHLHWALGGALGLGVSLPQRPDGKPVLAHLFHLWRPAAFCVALGLLALGALAAAAAGRLALPVDPRLVSGSVGVAGAVCVARAVLPNHHVGFFKRLRSTRWARYDTRLYSPLFLLLGLSLLRLAAG